MAASCLTTYSNFHNRHLLCCLFSVNNALQLYHIKASWCLLLSFFHSGNSCDVSIVHSLQNTVLISRSGSWKGKRVLLNILILNINGFICYSNVPMPSEVQGGSKTEMIDWHFQTIGQMSAYQMGWMSQVCLEASETFYCLVIRIILLLLVKMCAQVTLWDRLGVFQKTLVWSCWVYAFISSMTANKGIQERHTCCQSLLWAELCLMPRPLWSVSVDPV